MLYNRFVCGLQSKRTQQKLLSKADSMLTGAVEKVKIMEAAQLNVQVLKEQALPVERIVRSL